MVFESYHFGRKSRSRGHYPWLVRKLFPHFYQLGKDFAASGILNQEIIKKLAPRERLTLLEKGVYRLLVLTGMANMYLNMNPKKKQAFEKGFECPSKE